MILEFGELYSNLNRPPMRYSSSLLLTWRGRSAKWLGEPGTPGTRQRKRRQLRRRTGR